MKSTMHTIGRTVAAGLLVAASMLAAAPLSAGGVGTRISYQGRLKDGAAAANGAYDFEFRLFVSSAGAGQTGNAVEVGDVAVTDGLFDVDLDFGPGVFDGNELYLQIAVRPGASAGAYTPLDGRVRLDAVPFALHATEAAFATNASSSGNSDNLDGNDASFFAPAVHEHSVLASPSGNHPSVVATDDSQNTTFAGPLVFANGERLDNQENQVLRLSNDEEPGEIQLRADQAAGTSIRGGTGQGEQFVVSGLDAGNPGVDGDGLVLRGGDARPGATASGGTVTITPGEGADGGDDGQIFLNGYTSVGNAFEVGDMILKGTLTDFDGFTGTGGQVLTSTGGGGVLWETLDVNANFLDGIDSTGFATAAHTHSSLAASDGSPAQAVSANAAGDLVVSTGVLQMPNSLRVINNSNGRLTLERPGKSSLLHIDIDGDAYIAGHPSTPTGKMQFFPYDTDSPNNGIDMTVRAGNGQNLGEGAGGVLRLQGGKGANYGNFGGNGGNGGAVIVEGGDGSGDSPHEGGDVQITAGRGSQGGTNGDVVIETADSTATNIDAGDVELLAGSGAATGTGKGGGIEIAAGAGAGARSGTGGDGGGVSIRGGDANGTVARNGGSVSIMAGLGAGLGSNGSVFLQTPPSDTSGVQAGGVILLSGTGPANGAGAGGDIGIVAGAGGGAASGAGGRGGDILIQAGDGDTSDGTPQRGGNIVLTPGLQISGGGNGIVQATASLAVRRTTASHPIHVGTSASNGNGAHVTNGGVWTNGSDKNSKTAFEEIDPQAILDKVLALPVTRWQYQGEPEGVRHIGPMAQDFMEAFHLGESERHIGTVDADGVALAAIKGLDAKAAERFAALERENALLVERNKVLEERLSRLEESIRLISGQGNETHE